MTSGRLIVLTILSAAFLPRVASATSFYAETFFSGDARGYTGDGDWAWNRYKGQCNAGDPITGISSTSVGTVGFGSSLLPHAVLCSHGAYLVGSGQLGSSPPDPPPYGTERVHLLTNGADDRGDFATGNWDVFSGTIKAECGFNEAVTGVAEADDGSHIITAILCTWIQSEIDAAPSNCNTRFFSLTSDNRRSTSGGDWDGGYSKNQCGDSQILKGVSAVANTGEIHAILCCSSQPDPH